MLKRKIESSIISWIKNDKKVLLIDGARQVGKTFVIRKVLQELECDYIEFNLIQSPELVPLLSNYQLVDDMVTNLSLFTDKPFIKGKHLFSLMKLRNLKK